MSAATMERTRPGGGSHRADLRSAVEWIDRVHGRRLLRLAAHHGGGEANGEDAYQRTLLILYTKGPPLTGDQLVKWVTTVLKREAWAIRKREHRDRSLDAPYGAPYKSPYAPGTLADVLPDPHRGPEDTAADHDQARWRASLVAQLKPQERICLYLKGIGLSYDEIERVTGWSYTKINRLLADGRRALKALAPCEIREQGALR